MPSSVIWDSTFNYKTAKQELHLTSEGVSIACCV